MQDMLYAVTTQADGAQLPWRRGGPWDLTTLGLLCYFFFVWAHLLEKVTLLQGDA